VLLKIVLVLVALVVLGFLFVRSARQVRSEPYTIPRAHLGSWTLVLTPDGEPWMLALQPRAELVHGLFRQVFSRAMESMNMSTSAGIPVLLRSEYDRAFAGHLSPADLDARARAAGLENAQVEPRCLGHKRISEPGSTRQLYYAAFDAPAVIQFRKALVTLLPGGTASATTFDPAAQSPVLFIATSGASFDHWLPLRVDNDAGCVAPIVVE
jgi:hypothetical protein